jgi:hypothetical protein
LFEKRLFEKKMACAFYCRTTVDCGHNVVNRPGWYLDDIVLTAETEVPATWMFVGAGALLFGFRRAALKSR